MFYTYKQNYKAIADLKLWIWLGKMVERHIISKNISSQVEEIIIPKNTDNVKMFSIEEEEYLENLINKYSISKL